jgi:hypothetical protein
MGSLDGTHGSLSRPEPPCADSSTRSEVPVVRRDGPHCDTPHNVRGVLPLRKLRRNLGVRQTRGHPRIRSASWELGISSSPSPASRRASTDYVVYRCEPCDDTMLREFIAVNREEIIRRCRAKVASRSVPPPTEAEIDHGTVTLRVGASAERVSIEVQDECDGLPGGNVHELFRPFEQRSADRTGLGLGLAFSRWGVEANSGRISAATCRTADACSPLTCRGFQFPPSRW